ncbi:MAG: aminotransferase class V-fold PLP-dependent enzyme [Candidatus Hodgkinia cicadicola]
MTKVIDWFDLNLCANPGRASYFSAIKVKTMIAAARKDILGRFTTCRDKCCVFYKSATEAINSICYGLQISNGAILACPTDHNSMLGPVINVNRCVFVDLDIDHVPSVRNYLRLLYEDVSLIMLTHSSNVLGLAIPANLYGYLCEAKVYLLDGSQSVGRDLINLDEINCFVYIFSAHKLCALTGVGIAVGTNKLFNAIRPLTLGGGNISNISMDLREITFESVPFKHEAGTQLIYGPNCLNITMEWRKRVITYSGNYKFRYLWAKLRSVKRIKLYNKYTPSTRLASFTFDRLEADAVSMLLNRFLICIRTGTMCAPLLIRQLGRLSICRISMGIYNNFKDIDALMMGFAFVNNSN